MHISQALKQWLVDSGHVSQQGSDPYYKSDKHFADVAAGLLVDGELSNEKYKELSMSSTSPSPSRLFSNGDGIRVKDASEMYSEKRFTAKNKYGQEVQDPFYQREALTMSTAAAARYGSLFKHLAFKGGITNTPLDEHEKSLLDDLCTKEEWCGKIGDEHFDSISGHRNIKSLIDDGTSGGLEIAPISFDSDVVTFPLLHGELFPQVDLRPVPRGRRIEGASVGTPTMSWGGIDGTAISLFDTSSLVNAIDTTIHRVQTSVRVGRDFLSDSPVEVGTVLTRLIGERLQEELDDVIANGNGSDRPEGVFTKSGLTTVAFSSTTSLSNYESLLFGLPKQYRRDSFRPCFIGNDTSYQRVRALPVGGSDARRLFGMDEESYAIFSRPFKIQNSVSNETIAFGCMSKYRLYRRRGLEIRWIEGGDTLARNNEVLLVATARFGGQVVDANAFVKTTDAPA